MGLYLWFGLEPGRRFTLPLGLHLGYPSLMTKSNRDIPKKKRGPPSQGGRKSPQLVRMDNSLTSAIDHWREKQDDELSRPAAIRRLVEIALKAETPSKPIRRTPNKIRAAELAAKAIEKIIDPSAPPEERAQRRRRLTKGPPEFREARIDLPKAKK
jgi:hypothetical protein